MSRIWSSCAATGDGIACGGPCHRRIRFGDPMLSIQFRGLTFVRCRHCADEPVPDHLPPPVANRSAPIVPHLKQRGAQPGLPLDFKLAAAGREPGEDD
jgi:hypothetical protein